MWMVEAKLVVGWITRGIYTKQRAREGESEKRNEEMGAGMKIRIFESRMKRNNLFTLRNGTLSKMKKKDARPSWAPDDAP